MDDLFLYPGQPKKIQRDSRRRFTKSQEKEIWSKQNGRCFRCKKPLDIRTTKYHHIKPWSEGGKTETKNGQALHPHCHDLEHHEKRIKNLNKKAGANNQNKKNKKNVFNPLGDFNLPNKKSKNNLGFLEPW